MSATPAEAPVITGLATATVEEREALVDQTARELAWYEGYERFMTNADIYAAAPKPGEQLGRLALVTVDSNLAPIARLRNPQNTAHPSYLLQSAYVAHRSIGKMWRRELINQGVADDRIRLALTSLVRSQTHQDILAADPTKLAFTDSTHPIGAPADYDQSGYYWFSSEGELLKVSHPERNQSKAEEIGREVEAISEAYVPPTQVAPVDFDVRVIDTLIGLLNGLHEREMVNHILEFPGTSNQCSHVTPNPEVPTEEWRAIAA